MRAFFALSIDSGNPKGKRYYAIILLACRLGMRNTDIKNLKMEQFRWGFLLMLNI
jgi:integrase/recombinase XerD